jgi:hypothetical protein
MTDEELKELVAETSRQVRELRTSQAGAEARLTRSHEKLDQLLADLAASQKRTDKQLGELGNRFGGFTEGMALPSVREILYDRFKVDAVVADARARRNGRSIQIDAIGITNGDANAVYLIDIKSRLREEGLQQILSHLENFGDFFPEHRGKKLYGMLVAVDIPTELAARVLKQGIYLARIHGDLFELLEPEGFEPRSFPAEPTIGRKESR